MSVQAQDTIKPSDYIGKTVAFGSYYTDSDKEKSPLIWRVIDCNDNECLLTTDYVVIIGQYHSVEKPMTWKDSDLRYWLNNSFYKSSFNKEEQNILFGMKLKLSSIQFMIQILVRIHLIMCLFFQLRRQNF